MRILLILPDLDGGGAQKVALTLGQGLAGRGHEVHLLLMERLVEYDVPPELVLHSLTGAGRRMSSGWLGKHLLARRLRRWHAAEEKHGRFDLTIANLPFASEVVWLAGLKPVWHHIHNSLAAEISKLSLADPRKAARRLRRYRRIFDGERLIAVSRGVAEGLREQIGLKPARIETIYNAFDFPEIRRLAAQPAADIPSRPFVVHAGRFVPQKRHDILLDAYAASGIPHDLVLLAREEPALERLIRSHALQSRVTVAGFRANPYPWYRRAAALVLSSDFEGFGNVLVEALACGTPVVSTDCPSGPSEIMTGPLARYLSPPGDIAALARNLRQVVEAPPAIDPQSLERFSLARAVAQVEALVSVR